MIFQGLRHLEFFKLLPIKYTPSQNVLTSKTLRIAGWLKQAPILGVFSMSISLLAELSLLHYSFFTGGVSFAE